MTERFEAFKAALEALCVEHKVALQVGLDYDDYTIYAKPAGRKVPAGLGGCDLKEFVPPAPPSPAERKEIAARKRAERKRQKEWECTQAAEHLRVLSSTNYQGWQQIIDADAAHQRKNQMRVSTDPADPAYIDARPRRAWCNDLLIEGWVVADEFRRYVITADGKVQNGAVLVERLPAMQEVAGDGSGVPLPPAEDCPSMGFVGVFEHVPDAPKAPESGGTVPAPAAEAPAAKPAGGKRRR